MANKRPQIFSVTGPGPVHDGSPTNAMPRLVSSFTIFGPGRLSDPDSGESIQIDGAISFGNNEVRGSELYYDLTQVFVANGTVKILIDGEAKAGGQ
jgi:hypothetical protein